MSTTATRDDATLHLGFIPLIDCAPLVVARELGLDRRHGLRFELHRQASWAAVRDRLLSGQLGAAHVLSGLVHGVQTGIGGPRADMSVLMTLNHNGQAITLASSLADAVGRGLSLRKAIAMYPRPVVLAQTFPTGTHAMWLYYWLAAQGVDPVRDVRVVTLPPPQMPASLASGDIDGYCAGEPWSAEAEAMGIGRRVIRSGDIWPGHPEKILACRASFVDADPDRAVALTAAVLEACRWLDDRANRQQAVTWLARPGIIDLPSERIADCLLGDADEVAADGAATRLRFHDDGLVNVPWLSDGRWFLNQFRRWGLLPGDGGVTDEATLSRMHRLDLYRLAAVRVGVAAPAVDTRSSVLFDGQRT